MLGVQTARQAAWSREEGVLVGQHDPWPPSWPCQGAAVPYSVCTLLERRPPGKVWTGGLMGEGGDREFGLGPDSGYN